MLFPRCSALPLQLPRGERGAEMGGILVLVAGRSSLTVFGSPAENARHAKVAQANLYQAFRADQDIPSSNVLYRKASQ
jgi:hypothetical protein